MECKRADRAAILPPSLAIHRNSEIAMGEGGRAAAGWGTPHSETPPVGFADTLPFQGRDSPPAATQPPSPEREGFSAP